MTDPREARISDPRADTIREALVLNGYPDEDTVPCPLAALDGLLADAAEQRERADLWFDIAKEREARLACGRVAALQTDLAGVISLARHLWAMIPQHVWRAGGGDDGQGHYEGDYHAESVREQLDAFAARAALAASAPDTQQETK